MSTTNDAEARIDQTAPAQSSVTRIVREATVWSVRWHCDGADKPPRWPRPARLLLLVAVDHLTGGALALGEVGAMVRVGGHRQRSAQPGCGNNQNPNLSQKPGVSGVLLRCRMTYAIRRHQRHGFGHPPYRLNVWRRPQGGHFMTEITRFVALAFDLIGGRPCGRRSR
jgi:hypothetical protein